MKVKIPIILSSLESKILNKVAQKDNGIGKIMELIQSLGKKIQISDESKQELRDFISENKDFVIEIHFLKPNVD